MNPIDPSDFAAIIPPRGAYRCRGAPNRSACPVVLEHPGVCPGCATELERSVFAVRIRASLRREIPERFAFARWGAPELASRVQGGAKRCDAARRACASGRAVLLGGAGTGKTSLAAAWLRERIEAGDERVRFVAAHDLTGPSYLEGVSRLDLAISAHRLVVDDLGEELASAPPGGGVFAQRVEAMVRLIRTRHDQGLPTVFTTGRELEDRVLPDGKRIPGIASLYGDGVARRVFESAAIVRFGGG